MKKRLNILSTVLIICSLSALNGCTLYEDVDTEINKCPQTTPTIDPLPWDPQPEDETETGH